MKKMKPKLVGGIGDKDFGNQYRQGNRVYDSNSIAMCLNAQPLGNLGGYSYLYLVREYETNLIRVHGQRNRETPKLLRKRMEVKVIGQMDNSVDHTFESANRIYDTNGLAPTLPTGCGGGHLPKIITRKKHSYDSCICIEIPTLVKKRKYQIDILSLQNLLRVQKKRLKIATKDIAKRLNISITQAEHYFRTDKYFAIPDEDVWDDLANILEIKDKDLGMKIKTFVYQKGVFEKNERNYSIYGLCPTIMAFDDIRIIEK